MSKLQSETRNNNGLEYTDIITGQTPQHLNVVIAKVWRSMNILKVKTRQRKQKKEKKRTKN